ncbi:MAG: polysaccharide biosynthesis/export family protein [Rhizorhabdus sp.]
MSWWHGRETVNSAGRIPLAGVAGALFLLSMAGCATSGELPALSLGQEQAAYRLGAGDELKVTVYGEESLTGEFAVSGQGSVAFPLLGELQAAGKTVREFEQHLTAGLANGFINNPSVSVEVANYRPYYILGEVARPGEFAFVDGLTVFSAVARAGGFTYRANQSRIHIRHKEGGEEMTYRLDGDTPVQPGDTIRVSERYF